MQLTEIVEFHRHFASTIILVYRRNALSFLLANSGAFVLTVPCCARISVAENLVERFEIIRLVIDSGNRETCFLPPT
jgi:hypothetical protein